jgi:DNA-binding NarL/FixJ family response regulator
MYSERFKQKLLAPIRAGTPAKHVAARNKVSYNQVCKWCKAAGIKLLKGGIHEKGNYAQRTLDIITLLQCGVSRGDISAQLDVSRQWVHIVAKREGL